MTMTRKDYVLIADAIRRASIDYPGSPAVGDVIVYVTRALAKDDPRFDRERFVAACLGDRLGKRL